jgi:ferrous iron transport protein B
MKKLTIGLIGNPNSGKTTLFNQLTGARQRVGNWAGVTVERKEGQFTTTDHQVTLVDLPGTYSLTTISSQTSLDEQIACHYILSGDADLLINVVDASNLERNLYLTLQLLELGIPCIVALNMLDIAEKQKLRIDVDALSARLGCPVVPLVSTRARGIDALKLAIDRHREITTLSWCTMPSRCCAKPICWRRRWTKHACKTAPVARPADAGRRYLQPRLRRHAADKLDATVARLSDELDDPALHIADARYQAIAAICDVVSNALTAEPSRFTAAVDKLCSTASSVCRSSCW